MPTLSPRRWLWIALAASLALLTAALALERLGGVEPCRLCALQGRVHWAVVGVSVVGLIDRKGAWSARVLLGVLGALFLIGAGIAIQQAATEWRFLPAPEGCSGTRGCDVAGWRILGLSMAGWNALASLALAAGTGWVAARRR